MDQLVTAHISLSALRNNLAQVRKLVPTSQVLAIVKGDGYGHGLLHIAPALSDADAFGVMTISEAKAIRKSGVQKPIVFLSGFSFEDELKTILACHGEPVIHQERQVNILENSRLSGSCRVWLKVNTGMNRLGFSPEAVSDVVKRLENCACVRDIVFMTHFSDSDVPSHPRTLQQMDVFNKAIKGLSGECSLANSHGILNFKDSHADWVRPGIMLYAGPLPIGTGEQYYLQSAMTLTTRLIAIRAQHKGDEIGYSRSWRCPDDMLLGIAPIGYSNGYSRYIPSGCPVLVDDQLCETVGCVSMNMIAIDLTHYPQAKIGNTVELWGSRLPIARIAHEANTVPGELLTNVHNCHYIYTD